MMGNSFILKDASGRACGYLLARKETICCRVSCLQEDGVLTVCTGGVAHSFALEDESEEHRFAFSGEEISSAFVTEDGRIRCATDWHEATVNHMGTDVPKAQAKMSEKNDDKADKSEAVAKDALQTAQSHGWPERRWPPPPCWPQAKYVGGQWR